jgi:methylglutaconyl-CoA hydratase
VPAGQVDAEVRCPFEELSLGAPEAIARTKSLTRAESLRSALEAMQQLSSRTFATGEGREGVRAFVENRPLSWVSGQ